MNSLAQAKWFVQMGPTLGDEFASNSP